MDEIINGVYCIQNIINGKRYIGKANNIYKRWKHHRHMLSNCKHHNKYLQREFDKYGIENFYFSVLECGDSNDEICELEKYYIQLFQTRNPKFGYNFTDGGEGILGYKFSDEARDALSERIKGENNPNFGNKYSQETRKRISDSKKGKSFNKGQIVTEETRRKISEANKGKFLGIKKSKETKERMSKPKTEEHRNKMSESFRGEKRGNNHSSEYIGVNYNKKLGKWVARMRMPDKTTKYIGLFETEIEAAIAYDELQFEIYGELAKLNFP